MPVNSASYRRGVLDSLKAFAGEHEYDDSLVAELAASGFTDSEAEILCVFVPIAFGRVLLEQMGVTGLSDQFAVCDRHGQWVTARLIDEPVFAAALDVAPEVLTGGSSALFEAAALRCGEMQIVNEALLAGKSLDGARWDPTHLVRVTKEALASPRPNLNSQT